MKIKFNRIRYKVWKNIRSIFKINEGQILPFYMIIIRFFIFPFNTLWGMCLKLKKINPIFYYDFMTDSYHIHGKIYSDDFFRCFSDYGIKNEIPFKIVERKYGTLIIEEIIQ